MGRRQCRGSLDGLAKPLAQTLLALLVVGDLFEELFLLLFKEADRFHRVRRQNPRHLKIPFIYTGLAPS